MAESVVAGVDAGSSDLTEDAASITSRFSWPSFWLPWLWYFAHGLWPYGLLFTVGPLAVGGLFAAVFLYSPNSLEATAIRWLVRDVLWGCIAAFMAFRANRLAINRLNGRRTPAEFESSQRVWEKWTVIVAVVSLALLGLVISAVNYSVHQFL